MFKTKKGKAVLALETQEKADAAVEREKNFLWVKRFTLPEMVALFAVFESKICFLEDPSTLPAAERKSYQKMTDMFYLLKETWFSIDRALLSYDGGNIMFEVINYTIPATISEYRKRVLRFSFEAAVEPRQLLKNSNGIELVYFESSMYHFIKIIDKLEVIIHFEVAKRAKTVEVNQNAVKKSSFPRFVAENSSIAEILQKIELLWVENNAKKNTPEHEFFIEQVAESYLPEAWKMFTAFKNTSSQNKETVENILLEQLSLIEKHLTHISRIHDDNGISAMKAQLGFIQLKTANKADPGLALKK